MESTQLQVLDKLAEEYRMAALENEHIVKDFAAIDLEGWEEG